MGSKTVETIISAIAAGVAISIGCIAYLSTGYAWLFPIGLFIVCYFGFNLYTGRICWISRLSEVPSLFLIYFFNTISAYLMGIIISFAKPGLIEKAQAMVANKINSGIAIIPLAILCNVMIFVAVHCWKYSDTALIKFLGLSFATMIFVYCGFEHCIANAFYFGLVRGISHITTTIYFLVGNAGWNSVGGVLARRTAEICNKLATEQVSRSS